jgi:hypothetical protein
MTIRRAIAILIALTSSMAGCVSTMVSTVDELRSVSEGEGVVIGSVFMTTQKAVEDQSFLGGLFQGGVAEKMDWSIFIWEDTGLNPFKRSYRIVAKLEKEEIFIKKLPVGSYRIDRIETALGGGRAEDTLAFALAAHFSVKPRQVIYIGKLAVNFPHRVRAGSPVEIRIVDAQDETIEKLRAVYPSIVGKSVKELAIRGQ